MGNPKVFLFKKKRESVISLVNSSPIIQGRGLVKCIQQMQIQHHKWFLWIATKYFCYSTWCWLFGITVVSEWGEIKKDKQLRMDNSMRTIIIFYLGRKKPESMGRVPTCQSIIWACGADWTFMLVITPRHVVWPKKEVRNKNSYYFCLFHLSFKKGQGETTTSYHNWYCCCYWWRRIFSSIQNT